MDHDHKQVTLGVSAATSEHAQADHQVTSQPATRVAVAGLGRGSSGSLGDYVQPSLRVGAAGDPCEVEAEENAREIVGALRRRSTTPAPIQSGTDTAVVARLRRTSNSVGAEGGALDPATERALQSARGAGRPLTESIRRQLEPIMGADLSGVRLHEGEVSRRLNDEIQARAFTIGADIFFRDGVPSQGNADGDHLLAHELTHTVQQSAVPALRRMAAGGIVQRAPGDDKMPQAGTAYDLATARSKLMGAHHSVKAQPNRKGIAKAWGMYIFTNFKLGGEIKAGKVRDTYKSSFDKGHDGEFSVSQEVDGVPEIVIHAHMDKDGKAKGGNAVHWKWADNEFGESHEMPSAAVQDYLDQVKAKEHWKDTGMFNDWMKTFGDL
jgi:hypothetical protein